MQLVSYILTLRPTDELIKIAQLSAEIASGVKPEAIVKVMSESFRQQIQNSGLQDTQALLSTAAQNLKKATKDLGEAIEPITARYNDLAYKVERRSADLNTQSSNLARTAEHIQKKNAELVAQAQNANGWSMLALIVFALLVGVFCGITWEQRQVGSLVVDLQSQVGELQQIIKNLPATLNPPPPPKKQKRGQ